MSGILAILGSANYFARKTISVGTDSVNYGYFDGSGVGDFGSIDVATFTDHGGNSRQIGSIYWTISATGSVVFELETTSVSNSNTTFVGIDLQGFSVGPLLRSAATYNANNGDDKTRWSWSSINTSGWPTSGSRILLLS